MVYVLCTHSWRTLPPYENQFFGMTAMNNQLVLVGGMHISSGTPTGSVGWRITNMDTPLSWDANITIFTIYCVLPKVANCCWWCKFRRNTLFKQGWAPRHSFRTMVWRITTTQWMFRNVFSHQWKRGIFQEDFLPRGPILIISLITNIYSVCVWMSSSLKLFHEALVVQLYHHRIRVEVEWKYVSRVEICWN